MKYSIIIPAYNIEDHCCNILSFIEKTKKTRNDIEYIIINDGSTDKTEEILSSKRGFLYISQTNKGVSASRNLGIESANGSYLLFLDADDSFDDNIFNVLDDMISINIKKSDLFFFNYSINNVPNKNNTLKKRIYSNNEILHGILTHKVKFHICSICFKKEFILKNNIKFPEDYKFGEDIYFILSSLILSEKEIYYINKPLFNYNWDNSTTVKSPITKNKIDVIDLYQSLEKNSKITEKRLIKDIVYFKQRTFFYLLKLSFKFNIKDKETLDYLFNKKNILRGNKNSLYPIILIYYLFEKIIYKILDKKLQRPL
ncbi:glycosyltransferase family 2 protein [Morganella morganii]|uniref:glycosyltransferase family 2 protein n=1 Tax=Morganella morganii TaxID=582 RepID=UPI003EBCF02B